MTSVELKMHLYRFSLSGVDNFISLHAGLSTKTNYVKHEIFSRSITLLVIISRISNNLRCKTCFLLPSQEKNVVYLSTYLHYWIRYILKCESRANHTLCKCWTSIFGTTLYSRNHYCHQQKS